MGKENLIVFPTYFTFSCTERSQVYHFWKLDMPVNLPEIKSSLKQSKIP